MFQAVCDSSDKVIAVVDLLNPSCIPCWKISNANSIAYFRTDFSYIQPVMQLIESYVIWLNITKEITFIFTNKKGNVIIIIVIKLFLE